MSDDNMPGDDHLSGSDVLEDWNSPIVPACSCDTDYVCDGDLALLGQLVRLLTEATALFPTVIEDVLRVDELGQALDITHRIATDTFSAASLLNHRAALAQSWASGPSRPTGIHGRHAEAVRGGHPRISPTNPPVVVPPPQPADVPPYLPAMERTQCTGLTKSGGRCRNRVMYFPDDGTSADHCLQHASATELKHRDGLQAAQNDYVDAVATQWFLRDVMELPDTAQYALEPVEIPVLRNPAAGSDVAVSVQLETAQALVRLISLEFPYKKKVAPKLVRTLLPDVLFAFTTVRRATDTMLATLDVTDNWVVEWELAGEIASQSAERIAEVTATTLAMIEPATADIIKTRDHGPGELAALIRVTGSVLWGALHTIESITNDQRLRHAASEAEEAADLIWKLFGDDEQRQAAITLLTEPVGE
ncbi:hypothetical protein OHB26_39505 (plasmid) [Nocardia sp. NBC_01503]|uniref:hypothetical protein n=1 Tax=Nocardia sp. NBC_01503 TaxID=2975997 RepID=UPI002E7AB7F2|nr:hypothetical protein [Nocardia sp. NBC_01503]WTL36681.1 hypothetical protein OHB26_39070 [Nocardia sp. NBC_01503]WTL36766.1 hypothetical protein OHB26_39505 [Nocardia sp. NBC_01503]